jgi:trans-2-enoyl-CoA reductase
MSTATFDQVADGVYTALRRQFGGSADVVETGRDERTAVFGFTVDGVDYSLSVNITE